jgi:hypothetical protein
MADAQRWEDDTGRVRWQPITDSGFVPFDTGFGKNWVLDKFQYRTHRDTRLLYRWRWRAVRVARRYERQQNRQFHLVREDDE